MADDVRFFTVTCPAGTQKTAAQFSDLAIPPRVVRQVEWRVPNGAMGTMGFLLAMNRVPVLPVTSFTWVVANDEHGVWYPSNYPDSGSWQCVMYNLGVNPHSVYLTFHMDLPESKPALQTLIPAYEIMPAADLSKSGPPVRMG
jgi:hypothetical protein